MDPGFRQECDERASAGKAVIGGANFTGPATPERIWRALKQPQQK